MRSRRADDSRKHAGRARQSRGLAPQLQGCRLRWSSFLHPFSRWINDKQCPLLADRGFKGVQGKQHLFKLRSLFNEKLDVRASHVKSRFKVGIDSVKDVANQTKPARDWSPNFGRFGFELFSRPRLGANIPSMKNCFACG